jgi:hypothetical protein
MVPLEIIASRIEPAFNERTKRHFELVGGGEACDCCIKAPLFHAEIKKTARLAHSNFEGGWGGGQAGNVNHHHNPRQGCSSIAAEPSDGVGAILPS